MIRYFIMKTIRRPLFFVSVGIMLFLWISGCFEYLVASKDNVIDVVYLIRVSAAFGVVLYLMPIVTALPFLARFVESVQNKVMYYQMIRSSPKKYFRGQIIGAIASAALVGVISIGILTIIFLVNGAGFEAGIGNFFEETCMYGWYHSSRLWLLYLWHCVIYVLYGLPWIFFSFILSLVTTNRYILIAAPFVCNFAISYIVEILESRYLGLLWLWPLQTILDGGLVDQEFWTIAHTIAYPLLYHFGIIAILGSIYFVVANRRFVKSGR